MNFKAMYFTLILKGRFLPSFIETSIKYFFTTGLSNDDKKIFIDIWFKFPYLGFYKVRCHPANHACESTQ